MSIKKDYACRGRSNVSLKNQTSGRRVRLSFLVFGILIWSGLLVYRLSSIQIEHASKWRTSASKQHFKPLKIASPRVPITDREGRLMSVSVPTGSVFLRPKKVPAEKQEEVVQKLSKILNIDSATIEAKFNSKSPFVWISRQVPRPIAEKVRELDVAGVDYTLESRRYNPYGQAASTLLGKVGVDGNGLSGIERIFDSELKSRVSKNTFARDGIGHIIEAEPLAALDLEHSKESSALKLTLDAHLQLIVDEELEIGRQKANAKSGMAVMVDVETGDVLAMSQAPQIDFNSKSVSDAKLLKNIITETVYEPGSTLKPLVAAAAIDAGVARPQDAIDCENGRYYFGKHIIKDVHPVGLVTLRDVVIRSSNIGMTKIGQRLGTDKLYGYLRKFGFGEGTHLGLPGESSGILRNKTRWAKVDIATHSFGQGLAVTPLQMVRAVSAIANGGLMPELRVVQAGEELSFRRVVSAKAAKTAQELMYGVVEDEHGTGKRARIEGIRVGGKTGTAQKAKKDGRGYEEGLYVASFVGFADASNIGVNRSLALIVIIDEPHTDTIYGGTLAAPVFKRIMQRTLHYYGMSKELREKSKPDYLLANSATSADRPI